MSRLPLTMVVAVARDGVIGRDGDLPWHYSEDLRHFKRVTLGHAVIMGRRTYESIGRPLPKRTNIVLSRQSELSIQGCEVVATLEAALRRAREEDPEPCIIGGAGVYGAALPLATRIHLTQVDIEVEGDTYFPELDWEEWNVVQERTSGPLRFLELVRTV